MTKGLWVYCLSPMFSKTCTFLYFFTFFFTCSVFGTISFPLPSCHYFTILFFYFTISIMAQLLSFILTRTISGFLALISLSHWIITSDKIFTSLFSTTPEVCSYHFSLLFRLQFPHNFQWTIFATLSCLLLYSFCVNFSHSRTAWDIVSLFVSYLLQFGDRTVLSILCFTQVSSSNSVWIPSYSLYLYILLFLQLLSLTTYQSPSSHFPAKIYPANITFGMQRAMHCQTFWSFCISFLIHLHSIS